MSDAFERSHRPPKAYHERVYKYVYACENCGNWCMVMETPRGVEYYKYHVEG